MNLTEQLILDLFQKGESIALEFKDLKMALIAVFMKLFAPF